MFDRIKIAMECPYCREISMIEAQTKELKCALTVFKKGDFIGTTKYNYIDCSAGCHSEICVKHEAKRVGYKSGYGRLFNVRIFLQAGVVTGEYLIL